MLTDKLIDTGKNITSLAERETTIKIGPVYIVYYLTWIREQCWWGRP